MIHSLWVPALNRKIDVIPGRTNHVVLRCRPAGRLPRPMRRVLRPPARAHGAVRRRGAAAAVRSAGSRARPAPAATGDAAPRARPADPARLRMRVLPPIAGTNASGTIGPDLTHLASRLSLGAGDDPEHARATSPAGSSTRSTSSRATGCPPPRSTAPSSSRCSPTWRAFADGRAERRAARAGVGRAAAASSPRSPPSTTSGSASATSSRRASSSCSPGSRRS